MPAKIQPQSVHITSQEANDAEHVGRRENTANSANPPDEPFRGNITGNLLSDSDLAECSSTEILIGTQNDSPETITDGEFST